MTIAWPPDVFFLKNEIRILGHSSNPVSGFSMMEQVMLCAVQPIENWLGSSMNHIHAGLDENATAML